MRCPQWSRGSMVVVFGVGFALSLHAQKNDGVKIEVDPSVRSEDVHVYYFLVGGFGGYGGSTDVPPKPSTEELLLPIYRDAQRANSLKAVAYAKGCELTTFTLDPLAPGPSRVRFECR